MREVTGSGALLINIHTSSCFRCFVKKVEQEKKLYATRKKVQESQHMIGDLQWELDQIRDETKREASWYKMGKK